MQPLRTSSAEDERRLGLAWSVHPADRLTPVSALERIRSGGERVALLESVEGPSRLARHSFLAVGVDGTLRARADEAVLRAGEDGPTTTLQAAPLEALRHAVRLSRESLNRRGDHPDLPPFTGGWIGFATFELAARLEPSVAPFTSPSEAGADDLVFDHASDVVAFDHAAQTVTFVSATHGLDGRARDARGRIEAIEARLGEATAPVEAGFRPVGDAPRHLMERDAFLAGVDLLKREILRGEIFQAVLSQAFEQRFEGDPFTLYRVLRLVNPAPHMFFFGNEVATLVGSSPERLVAVKGRAVELVPIAGTRPRSADPNEDAALGAELMRDAKELAEHDMLVDLARNDAGRVGRVGTVRVHEHRRLVRFPRVQHIVSRVHAELASGRDALDAFGAAFPAGTVSGAPKVRALQLIAGVEGAPRGAYGGAFGYIDRAGDLDFALTIRTIVCTGSTLRVQAGAGVVFDSDPAAEYAETLHKASALFEAIRLAAGPAFQPSASVESTRIASTPDLATR